MSAADMLLKPEECVMLLVDFQAGLSFGVESIPRQLVLNNAVGLARTAVAFKVPVIASTSASRVYSGPLLPGLQEALPFVKAIERRSLSVWEDDTARNAVVATNLDAGTLKAFVSAVVPLEEASLAYSRAVPDKRGYGKVVGAVSA